MIIQYCGTNKIYHLNKKEIKQPNKIGKMTSNSNQDSCYRPGFLSFGSVS